MQPIVTDWLAWSVCLSVCLNQSRYCLGSGFRWAQETSSTGSRSLWQGAILGKAAHCEVQGLSAVSCAMHEWLIPSRFHLGCWVGGTQITKVLGGGLDPHQKGQFWGERAKGMPRHLWWHCHKLCKNGGLIEMPLGLLAQVVSRNHVLDWGPDIPCKVAIFRGAQWHSAMSPAKTAESFEMLFGLLTWVGPRKHYRVKYRISTWVSTRYPCNQ